MDEIVLTNDKCLWLNMEDIFPLARLISFLISGDRFVSLEQNSELIEENVFQDK